MNSPKMSSIERMLKHWIAHVPPPADGRSRLLSEAARRKQAGSNEISWFSVLPHANTKLHDYLYFPWPVIDGIQIRSALSI